MIRRKLVVAAGSLIALIVVLVWVQGGFRSKIQGGRSSVSSEKESKIRTVAAKKIRTEGDVTVSGTVAANRTADISARISGYVVALNVDAGDHVTEGQELLRIDTKALSEQAAQAEAALESARADLINAESDFRRYKGLLESQAIAKRQYDEVRTRYEVAKAAEQRAKAALEFAKTQLSYGTVKSPFDGIVGKRVVNVGDLAVPGRLLLSVYMPGTLEMVAAAGEQYAPYLKQGSKVVIVIPSTQVTQSSVIREIVPQRNEQTRTITVKAPLKDAPGLSPGIYGTLTFSTRQSEVIAVPSKAVKVVGQLESVQVLKDGVVQSRYVKTGQKLANGEVEILSGLDPGEKVVVE